MNYSYKKNKKNYIKALFGTLLIGNIIYATILYIQKKNINHAITATTKNASSENQPPYCGYSFISTNNGKIVKSFSAQPITAHTIAELFLPRYTPIIEQGLKKVEQQKTVLIKDIYDESHPHWLLLKKQDDDYLYGCIIFPREITKPFMNDLRHLAIKESLSLLIALCCLFILIGLIVIRNHYHWWHIVYIISSFLLIELGYLWHLRSAIGFPEEYQAIPLLSQDELKTTIQKQLNISPEKSIMIPTGIYIEYAQFATPNNDIYPGILLNGYIWQRYNKLLHSTIDRGFNIPNAFTITTREIFHETQGDEELICWTFSVLLFQEYRASLYPFDHRHIMIPLVHVNFEKNITLIPDFTAYDSLMPDRVPGLSVQTAIPYWSITNSFFAFSPSKFNTTLGSSIFNKQLPYLTFVITAQRLLIGEFIMYFILILTILLIAFILLLAFLKQTKITSLLGFSTLGVAGSCSGLLFVLITSQVELRQHLVVQGIVYLEYLYFVCYFMLLGVIINAIVFALKQDIWVIAYENNLILKLLYWPTTLSLIVGITAYMFY